MIDGFQKGICLSLELMRLIGGLFVSIVIGVGKWIKLVKIDTSGLR